jgi:hypothetical protein
MVSPGLAAPQGMLRKQGQVKEYATVCDAKDASAAVDPDRIILAMGV